MPKIMAKLAPTVSDARFDRREHESVIQWLVRTNDLMQQVRAASDALDDGVVVGRLLTFEVADGVAEYIVVSASPPVLLHIPHGDGYQIGTRRMEALSPQSIRAMVEDRLENMRGCATRYVTS